MFPRGLIILNCVLKGREVHFRGFGILCSRTPCGGEDGGGSVIKKAKFKGLQFYSQN